MSTKDFIEGVKKDLVKWIIVSIIVGACTFLYNFYTNVTQLPADTQKQIDRMEARARTDSMMFIMRWNNEAKKRDSLDVLYQTWIAHLDQQVLELQN